MDEPQLLRRIDVPAAHGDAAQCAARLVAALQAALQGSGYYELTHVCCRWADDAIVVTGQVSSYYMKQMAQCIVQRVAPSVRIHNRVDVLPPDAEPPR
jgi:DUF1680 family protein